jgi:presenilin-like A22 family membrane protease
MFEIFIIVLVCGLLTIFFFLLEIHQSLSNLNKFLAVNKGISRLKLVWNVPRLFSPVILDTSVTLFAVWLFGMSGGALSMLTAMLCSVTSSVYFQIRQRTHPVKI